METKDLYLQLTQLPPWGHFSDHNAERGNPSIALTLLVEEVLSKCRELKQLEFVEWRGISAEKELYKSVGLLLNNNKPHAYIMKDH